MLLTSHAGVSWNPTAGRIAEPTRQLNGDISATPEHLEMGQYREY